MNTPVCLFTYNRLSETKKTIAALQQNYLAVETGLFIFSDGPKEKQNQIQVDTLRQYLHTINGFKSVRVIESPINKGLANSIISGVTWMLEKYERVIVLEDDLICSPNFLNFMNQALDFYSNDQNIQSISAYSLSLKNKNNEVYFQTRPGSWGWATWKDRWNPEVFNKQKINVLIRSNSNILKQFKESCGADISRMLTDSLNNKNDSWYVRWAFNHFINKNYSVYPAFSYAQNIGFKENGTHCKGINSYISESIDENIRDTVFLKFNAPDQKISQEFLHYFKRRYKIIFRLKLLKSKEGRLQIFEEIKQRMGLALND